MDRNDVMKKLSAMPADADVVIEVAGQIQKWIDTADVRYDKNREYIVIVPNADDLQEALTKAGRRTEQSQPGAPR